MRPWARHLGLLLGLIATAAFVLYAARTLQGQDLSRFLSGGAIAGIAIAAIGYSLIVPLSAIAWQRMLLDMKVARSWGELCIIMSITQLAKYIPGNVGQHIGRAAMSIGHGIPLRPYGVSVVSEAVLAVVAATFTGLLGCGLSGMSTELLKRHGATALPFIVTIVLLFSLLLARHLIPRILRSVASKQPADSAPLVLPRNRTLVLALAVYILNYAVFGTGITVMVLLLLTGQQAQWLLLTGCFALAWVVGFFAPGAPAGLGVREGLMLGLLQFNYSNPEALLIVIALRLATTAGDILCFGAGVAASLMLDRRPPSSSTPSIT